MCYEAVRNRWLGLAVGISLGCCSSGWCQDADLSRLTIKQIFTDKEFATKSFGPFEWLDDGTAYTTLEPVAVKLPKNAASNHGTSSTRNKKTTEPSSTSDAGEDADNQDDLPKQLVRYDTATGERTVLVTVGQLTPAGQDEPLEIKDYDWSQDKSKLLIFTNSVKVWRQNTRGDYWVLDLRSHMLRQVAADAPASTLMFAKFSPDARRVAFVRDNNIYVENLSNGQLTQLTSDGTQKLINGTFDWVYEEELDLRDGFRWSPDGRQIAYWQLDSNGIEDFYLINNTDGLYPTITPLPYPKVGTTNSACRIGVVSASGGQTRWIDCPGDPRDNYLASLEWVSDSRQLLMEQLNRRQNRRTLWLADAATGEVSSVFVDEDEAWIDLRHQFPWYQSDTQRLILSETDGWRHAYQVSLREHSAKLLTPGDFDVIDLVGIRREENGNEGSTGAASVAETGWLYFTASPDSPVHRYLFAVPLAGGPARQLTPAEAEGTHTYDVSPNGKWAVHTYSRLDSPPVIDLISLPSHQRIRLLEDNQEVRERLEKLQLGGLEFFRVTIPAEQESPGDEEGGTIQLDGWMIRPPNFDASKKYPVLFYVYTEPWGQTARDVWDRRGRYLWHLLLSQQGYLVMTVDNRGTPAPRGRAWRKSIYGKIGIVNVRDQALAAGEILKWPFVDSDRVGVWGWSGGGSMTLNAMFQHPEIYHVGMSVAPVADQRLYDTIYQERYMGLPDENEAGFLQGSPVTHAGNLRGKLLLVHGTGDDNVHYQNAEVLINELIRQNRPFDMMSYPNRSHSIKEGENTSQHLFELLTRYLTTHLPAGASD